MGVEDRDPFASFFFALGLGKTLCRRRHVGLGVSFSVPLKAALSVKALKNRWPTFFLPSLRKTTS
jgi:hypothetical protein